MVDESRITGRSRLWRWAAGAFVLINLGGAGLAIGMGEPSHAAMHAVLLIVGYLGWLLMPRRIRQDPVPAQLDDARIDYLQQSVDAVALEVERLGEGKRFDEKLRAVRDEISPTKKDQ
ncbi:MAG: hypothetical protein ABI994_09785 [Gemmatimonadales bacterium]